MKKLILFPASLVSALAIALVLDACKDEPKTSTAPVEATNAGAPPQAPLAFDSPSTKRLDAEQRANAILSPREKALPATPVTYRNAKTLPLDPKDDWTSEEGLPLKLPNATSGSSFEASGGSSGEGTPPHRDVPGQKIWATR